MKEALLRVYELYCRGLLFVLAVCAALGVLVTVAEIGGGVLWALSFVALPLSLWLVAGRQRRSSGPPSSAFSG